MADEEKIVTAEETDVEVEETDTDTEGATDDADGSENEGSFSDGAEESDEEEGKEEKPKANPNDDKPWKNEQNAKAASIRREAEKAAAISKARTEAVIEALGGVNPFTNEKVEDEADVAEYLTMKELEKLGKDPVADYAGYVKGKQKEKARAAQANQNQEEWIRKDREDFITKHPDVKLDELVGDEMFRVFSKGKVGTVPMAEIYSDYKAFEKKVEDKAKTKTAQILANNAASPGKLSSQKPASTKSISEMTSEEFAAYDEKVKSGKIKIE